MYSTVEIKWLIFFKQILALFLSLNSRKKTDTSHKKSLEKFFGDIISQQILKIRFDVGKMEILRFQKNHSTIFAGHSGIFSGMWW